MRKFWPGEVGTLKGAFESESSRQGAWDCGAWTEPNFDAAVNVAVSDSGRRSPHLLRNFVPSRFGPSQFAQATSSREPQFSQKTASAAFCAGHWGQFTTTYVCGVRSLTVYRYLRPEI